MRVFCFVSIVEFIGAPQSGPPRPLAAATGRPSTTVKSADIANAADAHTPTMPYKHNMYR